MPIAKCYDSFSKGNPRADWTNWRGGDIAPKSYAELQKKGTENYITNTGVDVSPAGFVLNRGFWDSITEGDKMINEKLEVRVVDNHYHIKVGCQETIVHDKKEALKWLGKLWDEHIKEE